MIPIFAVTIFCFWWIVLVIKEKFLLDTEPSTTIFKPTEKKRSFGVPFEVTIPWSTYFLQCCVPCSSTQHNLFYNLNKSFCESCDSFSFNWPMMNQVSIKVLTLTKRKLASTFALELQNCFPWTYISIVLIIIIIFLLLTLSKNC